MMLRPSGRLGLVTELEAGDWALAWLNATLGHRFRRYPVAGES